MVSAASKKLLKKLPPESEMTDIIHGLMGNSDQALAVTGTAYLDYALQLLLQASFRKLKSREKTRMFDGAAGGVLGTFTAKIRIAYATRLLHPQIYEDLLLLNDIRNVFAHTLHEIDFENELVAQDCAKLKSFIGGALWSIQETAKKRFAMNVLAIYLGVRQDVERHVLASALRDHPSTAQPQPSPGK